MEEIKIIHLEEIDSTNHYLRCYNGNDGLLMTIVWADFQTAGRGQGKNSWESEKGKNLTFSIKTKPVNVPVARQYVMLEAAALAVKDVLSKYTDGITIKWPNDIYWNDCKISGTLSECSVQGTFIKDCIIGTGINVNQQIFISDAPNPISLYQIIGRETDREHLLLKVASCFGHYLNIVNTGSFNDIHKRYKNSLYRRHGRFQYEDKDGTFAAEIADIKENGHLILRREDGKESIYTFKEVKFII